jgi:hypothetical protein
MLEVMPIDCSTRRDLLRKAALYESAALSKPHLAGFAAALRALAGPPIPCACCQPPGVEHCVFAIAA